MSEAAIAALVDGLVDHVQAITNADPERKADLYAKLGLYLTYHPAKQEVRAEVHLDPAPHGEMVGVRGGTRTNSPSIVLPLGSIPFDVSSLVEQAED